MWGFQAVSIANSRPRQYVHNVRISMNTDLFAISLYVHLIILKAPCYTWRVHTSMQGDVVSPPGERLESAGLAPH
jgi:hypothetical protein